MASYQQDVAAGSQPKDKEYQDYLAGMEAQAKQLNKQFGEVGASTSGMSSMQKRAAGGQYTQAEQPVRQQAAVNKYQLGSQIDARRSQISDQLQALRDQKESFGKNLATKQYQQEAEAGLGRQEQDWSTGQQIKEIDFKSYTNSTDRKDALANAYNAGTAEMNMMDAANEGQLQVNDINNYYSVVLNDLEQDMLDWQSSAKTDFDSWWKEFETKSKNAGMLTQSITDLARVGVAKYNE